MCDTCDILEDKIKQISPRLLDMLLFDHCTRKNIFWATDNYAGRGDGYGYFDEITANSVTGKNTRILRPRAIKSQKEQILRIKQKAEVFTPAWVCNAQNNSVDEKWFGRANVFNTEMPDHNWISFNGKIIFPNDNSWQDYVWDKRLEISCGEAPYLASRYDAVTGLLIPVNDRIGILDRKLRIVCENTDTTQDWLQYAYMALKSTYGYEWQGDSLLLAREALLYTFSDYYAFKFNKQPQVKSLIHAAYIISWNLWQMDGLTCCVPCSCHQEQVNVANRQSSLMSQLFPDAMEQQGLPLVRDCTGCSTGDIHKHNGIACKVADWHKHSDADKTVVEFHTLIK